MPFVDGPTLVLPAVRQDRVPRLAGPDGRIGGFGRLPLVLLCGGLSILAFLGVLAVIFLM